MDGDDLKWVAIEKHNILFLLKQFHENVRSRFQENNSFFWDSNDALMHREGLKGLLLLVVFVVLSFIIKYRRMVKILYGEFCK